ncbi:MAG: site-specific DNA-methyltransferase [Candidatus Omnitrophica bacterium]|nr:site-specific DNA-methyltransferase [Candidatus Omnitrophota bacterium]
MDKPKMHSPDFTDENIEKLAELFPNCVTENKDDKGNIKKSIDFDQLRQELSKNIVEGPRERYSLNWPGKREALLTANAPIAKTLRPCRKESVDFDTTQNLFIEGDNLDALKLMQETYLGKVKMIYIDPPYNTGNDFIYEDDFAQTSEEFLKKSNQKDEEGNRLVANTESNGRFHSDWLSMMYSRLKLARNLLKDDGVIFISIDDGEVDNLNKLCKEIFGEKNFIDIFSWVKTETPANLAKKTKKAVEYLLCYQKTNQVSDFKGLSKESKASNGLMNQTNNVHELIFPENKVDTGIKDGIIKAGEYGTNNYKIDLLEDTEVKEGYFVKPVKLRGRFKWGQANLDKEIAMGTKVSIRTESFSPSYEREEYAPEKPWNLLNRSFGVGTNENASSELDKLMGVKNILDYPKPTSLLEYILSFLKSDKDEVNNDIILDFFAGSGTTAHAVMQLNAEDGGNRKFIMVQIPELCDDKSEAYKTGFKTIADIGKERIRRVGKKIKEENAATPPNLDIGFRVFKVDSSNMRDVYYNPDAYSQDTLFKMTDNIKSDRTEEDLLFQVLLDWGVDLALPVSKEKIAGNDVFFVSDNALAACFVKKGEITEDFCKELAKRKPLRVVFRDDGFKDDSVKINVEQIFKLASPHTEIKTI